MTATQNAPYTDSMSDYTKNRFIAPHEHTALPPPDRTRMPAHLRDALQRPDPIRETEACGHLHIARSPMSVPGARVRCEYARPDDGMPRDTARVAIYIVDPEGKERLGHISLDREQVAVMRAALDAAVAEYDRHTATLPA